MPCSCSEKRSTPRSRQNQARSPSLGCSLSPSSLFSFRKEVSDAQWTISLTRRAGGRILSNSNRDSVDQSTLQRPRSSIGGVIEAEPVQKPSDTLTWRKLLSRANKSDNVVSPGQKFRQDMTPRKPVPPVTRILPALLCLLSASCLPVILNCLPPVSNRQLGVKKVLFLEQPWRKDVFEPLDSPWSFG